MRKALAVLAFGGLITLLAVPAELAWGGGSRSTDHGLVVKQMSAMPLAFTPNEGQWADSILFRAESKGATLWFTSTGVYHQLVHRIPQSAKNRPGMADLSSVADSSAKEETELVKATFVGGSALEVLPAGDVLGWNGNYFLGNEPCKWRTDVPNYSAITYKDVYPGIDLTYRGDDKGIEYDFAVSPGADPSQIAIRYDGASEISVDRDGNLVVAARLGKVIERVPSTFQIADGERKSIDGAFRPMDDHTFAFQLGDDYSPVLALVIDPVLSYNTYLGGGSDEDGYGNGIAVDAAGSAYVAGATYSSNFPTTNPIQPDVGVWDVFVSKLSPAGNSLVYSTYLGGGNQDFGFAIALDKLGSAYVTGYTLSGDYPTVNPYQLSPTGGEGFVTKLSPQGNLLAYSTYLGGACNEDYCWGIAVDLAGSAYVTGYTCSGDFPTTNAFQDSLNPGPVPSPNYTDAFVTKLSATGSALVYSTYLGGLLADRGYSIAVDSAGYAYVAGTTESSDFPVANAYDGDFNGGADDAFVTKLSQAGNALIYSTYIGGNDSDEVLGIAVDASGNAYVTGRTHSHDFPIIGAYQSTFGGWFTDAFVSKLSPGGDALQYSTFLGGDFDDIGHAIIVDASGSAYVTGETYSTNFPTVDPWQMNEGGADAFVTKLSATGNALSYSTYLGGGLDDRALGASLGDAGSVYVSGKSSSGDFPIVGPYQGNQGGDDYFVAKLSTCSCPCHADPKCDGQTDVLDVVGVINAAFRGLPETDDPGCPYARENVDCNSSVDILDVTHMINVAFRGMDPATEFCVACS